MAGRTSGMHKTFRLADADGVAMYRGVTFGANASECTKPTAANAVPLGVVIDGLEAQYVDRGGSQVGVQLSGIAEIELANAVAYGGRVVLDVGGRGIAVPAPAGAYNCLGFALKGGEAGDVVPVMLAYHVFTR